VALVTQNTSWCFNEFYLHTVLSGVACWWHQRKKQSNDIQYVWVFYCKFCVKYREIYCTTSKSNDCWLFSFYLQESLAIRYVVVRQRVRTLNEQNSCKTTIQTNWSLQLNVFFHLTSNYVYDKADLHSITVSQSRHGGSCRGWASQ